MSHHLKVRKYEAKRGGKKLRSLMGDLTVSRAKGPLEGEPDDEPSQEDLERFLDGSKSIESSDLRSEIEAKFIPLINENLTSEDPTDLLNAVDKTPLGTAAAAELIAVLLRSGLEHEAKREVISRTITTLSVYEYLTEKEIEGGFTIIFQQFPDLELDNPHSPEVIGKFLARAVADDCIRPAWVDNHPSLKDSNVAGEMVTGALQFAHALISVKYEFARLDTIWGITSGTQPVRSLINQIKQIIGEFAINNNSEEALQCLRELGVPHFNHEFVYEAILHVIENAGAHNDVFLALLSKALTAGFVPQDQINLGFERIYNDIDDISIDAPRVFELFPAFVASSVAAGFLPADKQKPVAKKQEGQ